MDPAVFLVVRKSVRYSLCVEEGVVNQDPMREAACADHLNPYIRNLNPKP